MFAVLGTVVVGVALMMAVDSDNQCYVYDWEKEKMVFIPDRQDILLELLLRS